MPCFSLLIAVTLNYIMQKPASKVSNDAKKPATKIVQKDSSDSSSDDESDSSSDDEVGEVSQYISQIRCS